MLRCIWLCTFATPLMASGLLFEANRGQTDPAVRYLVRSRGATAFLTEQGATFAWHKGKVDLRHLGASRTGTWRTSDQAAEVYSFTGSREQWRQQVPAFRRVTRQNLYRGVDAVYYGSGQSIEVDYIVRPGADPKQIRFRLTGTEPTKLTPAGDLVAGTFRQRRPVAFQDGQPVSATYRLRNGEITIERASTRCKRLTSSPAEPRWTVLGMRAPPPDQQLEMIRPR